MKVTLRLLKQGKSSKRYIDMFLKNDAVPKGDSKNNLQDTAPNKVGYGTESDIIVFHISFHLICACCKLSTLYYNK